MGLPEYPVEYFRGTSPLLDNDECWHRRGISDCPHCGADYKGKQYAIWEKLPYVTQMIFEPKYRKKARVITISYCPKCHMPSWVHKEFRFLLLFGPDEDSPFDLERVKIESDKLIKHAKEEWDNSICKVCKIKKKEIHEDKYGYWISCSSPNGSRMGPPEQPDEKPAYKCTRFKK